MAVGDAYVFPGFLTPVLAQLFFPKPPTTFSHVSAEVRGRKKSHLNQGSNSQPPGLESNTLTTFLRTLLNYMDDVQGQCVESACP